MRNFARLYLYRTFCDCADKVYIVTNKDQSTRVIIERSNQRVDTWHI